MKEKHRCELTFPSFLKCNIKKLISKTGVRGVRACARAWGGVKVLRPSFPPLLNLLYRVTQNQTVTHPRGSYFHLPLTELPQFCLLSAFWQLNPLALNLLVGFVSCIHQFSGLEIIILKNMWSIAAMSATCGMLDWSRCAFAHLRPSYFLSFPLVGGISGSLPLWV